MKTKWYYVGSELPETVSEEELHTFSRHVEHAKGWAEKERAEVECRILNQHKPKMHLLDGTKYPCGQFVVEEVVQPAQFVLVCELPSDLEVAKPIDQDRA